MITHNEITPPRDISSADQASEVFVHSQYNPDGIAAQVDHFMASESVTSQIHFLRRLTDEVGGVLDDGDERYYEAVSATLEVLGRIANDTQSHQLLAKIARIDKARFEHRFNSRYADVYTDDSLMYEAMQFADMSIPVPGEVKDKLPINTDELESAKMIASDACALYDAYYVPIAIYNVDGIHIEPLAPESESAVMLAAMHEPKVRMLINEELGLDICELSLDEQIHLLDYMQSRNASQYKRMIDTSQRLNRVVREEFVKAFLATEFGEDFGDALLDIAEYTSPEQAKHIFDTILQLRKRTSEFAHMFAGIDPELAESTEKAMNERITDALVAMQQVAVTGELREDVAPHRYKDGYVSDGSFEIEVNSVDKAIGIIDGLEQTYATIHRIVTTADLHIAQVNEDTAQFALYRLMSEKEGNMLVYVRPEGAYGYDSKLEYGNRKGVEASISFMVNPLDPYTLLAPKDRNAVSLRFDHEGRTVDESPDSPERDPTRADGLVSVDISSGVGDSDLLAVQIGRLIAAGNRIRAQHQGTEDSLHHNTNYLNQEKYGKSAGFADLAQSVIGNIELLRKTLGRRHLARAASRLPALDQAA